MFAERFCASHLGPEQLVLQAVSLGLGAVGRPSLIGTCKLVTQELYLCSCISSGFCKEEKKRNGGQRRRRSGV